MLSFAVIPSVKSHPAVISGAATPLRALCSSQRIVRTEEPPQSAATRYPLAPDGGALQHANTAVWRRCSSSDTVELGHWGGGALVCFRRSPLTFRPQWLVEASWPLDFTHC